MLNKLEIESKKILIKTIDDLVVKYQKKADKEIKAKKPKIVYKGEEYSSENELSEAYTCDVFSLKVYERLQAKLVSLQDAYRTKTESNENIMLVREFNKYKNTLKQELLTDEQERLHKEKVESRMKSLIAEGYSIRDAEIIVGNEINEVLMNDL